MATRVLVLGAGFGGLELSTALSNDLGAAVDVTLIDRADSFVFGYTKIDLVFGRQTPASVRIPYTEFSKPGVRLLREEVTSIDPEARSVTTDAGSHEADVLVIALGADCDTAATPGLAEGGNEFYTVAGAERLGRLLPTFTAGRALVGVCGLPFKCPSAPSEAALLLDEYLTRRGVRGACEISFVLPLPTPVPPSPECSGALLATFAERGIEFVPSRRVALVDPDRGLAILDDGAEMPFDLMLGVPRHRAPDVVVASGLTVDGFVPVDPRTLETKYADVYAIGDVATIGVPKAGVFAEGAGRAVAEQVIARVRGAGAADDYEGLGSCFVEFGAGQVGRVEVDFFSGPRPSVAFQRPSASLLAEKASFGTVRRARWFGG